jgi:hypothetical protein
MSVKMRFKRWLYSFVILRSQEGREPVWYSKQCVQCQQWLSASHVFCSGCGKYQGKDTEAITRIPHVALTDRIDAIKLPGERPKDAYSRLMKMKVR